jgi:hypothetical protein
MPDHAISLATLIFASLAGVGSVVRCYQNYKFHRWHRRQARDQARAQEALANSIAQKRPYLPPTDLSTDT